MTRDLGPRQMNRLRVIEMLYRHYELMHLLEGSVTLVDETGRTGTFVRGDIFLVEQGARCSWDSPAGS